MSNFKIILRANGGQGIGLGHIVRTCSLINLLPEESDISFLVNPEVEKLAKSLAGENVEVKVVKAWEASNAKEISSLVSYFQDANLVLIDGYRFKEEYLREVSAMAKSVVYIDDTFSNHLPVDLVINHAPGVSRENYDLGFGTILRTGPKYALLRNSFREGKIHKPESIKLLICIGGVDFNNITPRVVADLKKINFKGELDIILGSAASSFQETENVILEPSNFKSIIHSGLSGEEMANLMRTCTHAVLPASSVTFESIACGIFPGVGFYVDNQEHVYAGFKKLGLIFPLGDLNSDGNRQQTLAQYLECKIEPDNIEEYGQLIRTSKIRLRRDLNALLSHIHVREATVEDAEILFEWICDSVTVANSKSQSAPLYEDHISWLKKTLVNDKQLLQIASCSGEPIGQVRLDIIRKKEALVTVAIAPKMRGEGIATRMYQVCFRQALPWLKKHRIRTVVAQIRPENIASINIHSAIGFDLGNQKNEGDLLNYLLTIPQK